jgi:hypothetical protein
MAEDEQGTVNETLSEDESDLEMFEKRRDEPNLDFEEFVARLKLQTKPARNAPVSSRR